VTFRPRPKDGFAVFVQQSEVMVESCTVERAMQPAFYVRAGQLALADCKLDGLASDGVAGTDKATIALSKVTIVSAGKAGLVVQKGSSATIEDSNFLRFTTMGAFAASQSTLTVRRSVFADGPGRGIVVQDGSTLRLDDVRVERLAQSAVLGFGGATIEVRGGVLADNRANAIHFQDGGALTVAGVRFENNPQAVVVISRTGKPVIRVSGNVVAGTPERKTAIVVQGAGKATIENNIVIGAGRALSISASAGAPVEISRNTFVAAKDNAIAVQRASPRFANNRIVSGGALGVLLSDAPDTALDGNVVLSRGEASLWVQKGATVTTQGNVFAGVKQAVVLANTAGAGGKRGDDLEIKGMSAGAGPSVSADADAAVLAALAAQPGNLADFDRATVPLLKARDALLARARVMGHLSLQAEDRFGRKFPSGFVVNDATGSKVADVASSGAAARLAPGTYRLVPDFDQRLAQSVTLGKSE
jgi:hypothetical protein